MEGSGARLAMFRVLMSNAPPVVMASADLRKPGQPHFSSDAVNEDVDSEAQPRPAMTPGPLRAAAGTIGALVRSVGATATPEASLRADTTKLRDHCGVGRISGNRPGRGASNDCGAQHRKESNADVVRRCTPASAGAGAEHADASVRLQDRRPRSRYRRTGVAGIGSQAEPRPSPHPRALRASARSDAGAPSARPRRRTRFRRYTLARRVYGARFGCGQRLRHGLCV